MGRAQTHKKMSESREKNVRYVSVDQHKYTVLKVVWALHYGEWPEFRVTTKNRDDTDLRIENIVRWERGQFTGYEHWTKEGRAAYQVEYRKTRSRSAKNTTLKKMYGPSFTVERYEEMWLSQDGKCAICREEETSAFRCKRADAKRTKDLAVDHCHKTSTIRGLLCAKCNTLIGLARERVDILSAAVDYINQSQVTQHEEGV